MAQYGANRRLFGYVNGHGVLLERFLSAEMPPVLGYALTQAAYDQITPVEGTYYVIFDGAQATPIYEVTTCTQAEYEQLTPWANGLYIIEDSSEITGVYCGTTAGVRLYQGSEIEWQYGVQSAKLTDVYRGTAWSDIFNLAITDSGATQNVIIIATYNDDYGGKPRYYARFFQNSVTELEFYWDRSVQKWMTMSTYTYRDVPIRWNKAWTISGATTPTGRVQFRNEEYANLMSQGDIYTNIQLNFPDAPIIPTPYPTE